MEQNFTTILRELTSLNPHLEGSNIHTLDDPELLKFPVAYLSEPGYWYPTDSEVAGLRTYLDKGGFLIVDDFFDRTTTSDGNGRRSSGNAPRAAGRAHRPARRLASGVQQFLRHQVARRCRIRAGSASAG